MSLARLVLCAATLPDFILVLLTWTFGGILQTAALVLGVVEVCVAVRNQVLD